MNKNIIILIVIGGIIIVGIVFFVLFLGNNNQDQSPTPTASQELRKIEGYSGDVLAGTTTPFIIFNEADYLKAQSEGKIIFLDFYANWCPVCRAEAPELHAGFEELNNENIIGFRVNFNDTDTDQNEENLAKEFEIPYQYTKVIIKDGKVVLKDGTPWDKNKFLEELSKF